MKVDFRDFNLHALLAFFVIVPSSWFVFPSLWNLPYAEIGNMLLPRQLQHGFFPLFFAGEYSHWAFLPWILVGLARLFGLENFPWVLQGLTSCVLAFTCSFICWRTFREFVPSDWVRFCFAIAFGVYAAYESLTVLNVVYLLAPFVVLLSIADLRAHHAVTKVFLGLLGFLVVSSKSAMIVFAPGVLAAMALGIYRKRASSITINVVLLCGLVAGLAKTLVSQDTIRILGNPIPHFWPAFEYSLPIVSKAMGSVLLRLEGATEWTAIFWMTLFYGSVYLIFRLFSVFLKKRDLPSLVLLFSATVALFGSCYVFAIAPAYHHPPLSWSNPLHNSARALTISHPSAVLVFFAACVALFQLEKRWARVFASVLALALLIHAIDDFRAHDDPFELTDAWASEDWSRDKGCVQVNPPDWSFCR